MPEMVTITLAEYRDLITKAVKLEMITMDTIANIEAGKNIVLAVDDGLVLHVTGLAHYTPKKEEEK